MKNITLEGIVEVFEKYRSKIVVRKDFDVDAWNELTQDLIDAFELNQNNLKRTEANILENTKFKKVNEKFASKWCTNLRVVEFQSPVGSVMCSKIETGLMRFNYDGFEEMFVFMRKSLKVVYTKYSVNIYLMLKYYINCTYAALKRTDTIIFSNISSDELDMEIKTFIEKIYEEFSDNIPFVDVYKLYIIDYENISFEFTVFLQNVNQYNLLYKETDGNQGIFFDNDKQIIVTEDDAVMIEGFPVV